MTASTRTAGSSSPASSKKDSPAIGADFTGLTTIDMDRHLDPLRGVIAGVECGSKQVSARSDEVEWFDGNFVMDHSERLSGVAFVAAQADVERAVGDIRRQLLVKGNTPGASRRTLRQQFRQSLTEDTLPNLRAVSNHCYRNGWGHLPCS